jgi:peptidoglycan/xylan/chitin deacetylase (PgdA/CDA1 family)
MNKPNVLVISDEKDIEVLDSQSQSRNWHIFWKIIDYNKLPKKVSEIHELIVENDIDFVLYSRNDQVANRIGTGPITRQLRTGYSSFSGIDEKNRIEQMKSCFADFLKCDEELDFNISEREESLSEKDSGKDTFSLIFDVEQLGGVKYGLPRILEILNRYNVQSTFFMTNLMKKVYSNVLEEIQKRGHEVGIHGRWHEYLPKYTLEEQRILIKGMVDDFHCQIPGANFIGRMNRNTLRALIENGIEYFVYPMINYYKFFCYPKLPMTPFLVSVEDEEILMLPVSVETYGRPWISIKNMVDSAFSESLKINGHLTILLHPFVDGNLQHIKATERLLKYLVEEKKLKGIAVKNALPNDKMRTNVCRLDTANSLRLSQFIPRTKEDLIGALPENLMAFWRIIKKDRTMW